MATDEVFEAVLRIPETSGDLVVTADVRINKIRCRTTVEAPNEGTAGRRLSWLLKKLKDAPGYVQVEAAPSVATKPASTSTRCERTRRY